MEGGYGQKMIQLWNDWQVSGLVLLSLSLQLLFLSTAGVRKRAQPSWWKKTYFWALYIGSRFMATYSLGILSRASTGDANADVQAFWAALLLFHLGGPDDFTALSLEDNKLWDRRCFELIIQVLTTVYVFSRYFPDREFRRFIAPFALIFSAGVIKYIEQVVALRQATMEALIESVLGEPDAGPDYADTMDRLDGIMRSGALPSLNIDNERVDRPNSGADLEASEWVEAASYKEDEQEAIKTIQSAYSLFSTFGVLFADGIFNFKDRQESQAMFSGKDMTWAFKVVEIELSFVYDRLYTKASVPRTKRLVVKVISLVLTLSGSIWALLVILRASQYRQRHRCVTYTLLAGAVLADIVILASFSLSIWSLVHSSWLEPWSIRLVKHRRWSGRMAQSNLITFCLRKLPSKSKLLGSVKRLLRDHSAGGTRPVQQVAGQQAYPAIVSTLPALLAEELKVSDGFGRYFEKPSLLKQVTSGNFWNKYKQTKHVLVREELKHFIFKQLKKKERHLKMCEMGRGRRSAAATSQEGSEGITAAATSQQWSEGTTAAATSQQGREGKTTFSTFIASRGDQVVVPEEIQDLRWSLQGKEFDESLLIWHVATDLRFREERRRPTDDIAGQEAADRDARKYMEIARELSDYLYYIMVVHPLMLSSSTTMARKRCRDTCAEARRLFLKEHIRAVAASGQDGGRRMLGEDNAHDLLLKVDTPLHASVVKGDKSKSVLWDGCNLATELKQMVGDPRKRWKAACKVWVEMLCYAAVQCGGYQHAERLKDGGELITFVCLLMTHLGMGRHYRTEVGDAYAHLSVYTTAST